MWNKGINLLQFLIVAEIGIFITTILLLFLKKPETIVPLNSHFIEKMDAMFEEVKENHKQVDDTKVQMESPNLQEIKKKPNKKGNREHRIAAASSPSIKSIIKYVNRVNGYNTTLGDEIPLNRSLPDLRILQCKTKQYSKNLESVSVIIPFHNEHFSTLMRACWSIINRSPASLLEEIILVDDASNNEKLINKRNDYISKYLPKVRVIRLVRRSGFIKAKFAGAEEAKAKILVFLKPHIEVNVDWLSPLLEPIAKNYKICVCPFVDVIDKNTFEYRAVLEGGRGAFNWKLDYVRFPVSAPDLQGPSEPFRSPVMTGEIFAISAKFFWEIGGFDLAQENWTEGGFELSFKIWQCGGELYEAPCSRVGKINKKCSSAVKKKMNECLEINKKRVAEIWMDEYAEFLYQKLPNLRTIETGDLSEQKYLRKNLRCKPFKWFMKNIARDILYVYPTD